jgi:hypothetical protein
MDEETQGTEPEIGLDGLQKSLDELVQVADATEQVSKGYGGVSVEHSGRMDEDGKGGGGQAGSGDVGSLDNMMIAKMTEAGIPAGVISAFTAFLKKDDEEEEEEEESEKSLDAQPEHEEPIAKSMDEFREDPDLADAVDVSPFLEALTARTADQLDGIRKSAHVFQTSQNEVNRHLAAAVHQVGSLIKSQAAVIDHLGQRLGLVERTPAQPKGVTTRTRAEAMSKSMPGEAGGGDEMQLKKSEVLSALTYMNLEKGIKQVNGRPTYELACMYDGGAPLDDGTVKAVRSFLRANPHEADAARSYA